MSTTDCETGTVRIRVGLFNDILRFVRALCIILHGESYNFILHCDALIAKHTQAHSQHHTNIHIIHTHTHTHTWRLPPPGDAIHIIKRHSYTDTSHKAYKHTRQSRTHKRTPHLT